MLYFIPVFQAGKLAVPFFVLLILTFFHPPGWLFAFLFGVLFYGILLIKDLIFIDRRTAYELLTLGLSFLTLRDFYLNFSKGVSGTALIFSFLTAIILGFLMNSFTRSFQEDGAAIIDQAQRTAAWLSFLLLWQTLIVTLFLPMDFIYQTATAFLVVILLVDLVPEHLFGKLSRVKVLTTVSIVFGLFVIVLGSVRWSL